jgi:hypothetical protein
MSEIAGPAGDPLARPTSPERLAFNDGGLLTAEQLQLEQLYHRSRLARVLAYLHGSGTVAGLDVNVATRVPADGPEVQVSPGMAVDRLGRVIEVPELACLRLRLWFDQLVDAAGPRVDAARRDAADGLPEHVAADVYIGFIGCRRVPEPAFATANADQIDAVQASRIRDVAHLSLLIRPRDDNRLPQPTGFVADGDAATLRAAIREEKRLRLWDALLVTGEPPELPGGTTITEHLPDQDRSEVFLQRLLLPVARDGDRLRFDAGQPVQKRPEDARLYVYSAAELALFGGLAR